MLLHAANQNPPTPQGIIAAYASGNLMWLDQPHQHLARIGFSEREIMACGAALLAVGADGAGDAEQMIKRAGSIVAGLPLTDNGMIVSQLRLAGLRIRDIEIHLTDIIGEALRQRRLAGSGGRP